MTIYIYEKDANTPTEVWENYPCVPNVGDRVSVKILGLMVVVYRVFEKDKVILRVE